MEGRDHGGWQAWYRRADYKRVLETAADKEDLPETLDKWLGIAERLKRELIRSGRVVHRALLEPEAFATWCAEKAVSSMRVHGASSRRNHPIGWMAAEDGLYP